MAKYNPNLDIVRELLVPSMTATENYITDNSRQSKILTSDFVYIGDQAESRDSEMTVTDYAVFCGCDQGRDSRNAHIIFTRTPYNDLIVCKTKANNGAGFMRGEQSKFTYGIKPMIKLDVRAFVKYKDRLMKAPGVILGEMPQSVVNNMPLAAIMGKANKTGRVYPGHFGRFNEEYECGGDKYVLALEAMPFDKNGKTFPTSGKRIEQKKTWFEVAPIVWQIQNWDEMPIEINPKGKGTAKHVVLQAEDVLMSGIPFSLSPVSGPAAWRDSDLRLFLNGANFKRFYKHPETKEQINYDFGKYNFLNTCLEYNAVKQQEIKEEAEVPAYTPKEKEEAEEVASKPIEKIKIKNADILKVTVSDEELSVDEQIKFYIDNGKSFMLHGPSGVGKTRRVEEADPDFVSIVLRNGMLPEEVIGKTIFPNNDTAKESIWMPPVWYTNLCQKCEEEPERNHVLFIDEITNVKPAEQSLVFHLVLNRSIGPNLGQLPENVVVVAAGNNKQESEAAYNMPEPLFRRFEGHVYLEADVKDFIAWGAGLRKDGLPKIHPLVSRFVATYGDSVFYSAYDSEEPPKYALDPRGWEQVSNIIYSNKGVLSRQLLENKVGPNIAANLIEFARSNFISLENVLNGDYISSDIPARYDAQLALAYSLIMVDEENVQTVRKFIAKNLSAEILSAFDFKWVGDNEERAILLSGQKIEVPQKPKREEDKFNYSQMAKDIREKEEEEIRSKLANSQAPATNSAPNRPKPIVIGPIPTSGLKSDIERKRARLLREMEQTRWELEQALQK